MSRRSSSGAAGHFISQAVRCFDGDIRGPTVGDTPSIADFHYPEVLRTQSLDDVAYTYLVGPNVGLTSDYR